MCTRTYRRINEHRRRRKTMGSSAPLRPEGDPAGMPYLSLAAATIYNIAKVTRRRRGRQFGAFRPVTRLRHYNQPAAAPAERSDWCTRCIFAFYSYIKCNCLVARRSPPQWSSFVALQPATTSTATTTTRKQRPDVVECLHIRWRDDRRYIAWFIDT